MAVKDQVEALLRPVIEDLGYEFVGMELNQHPKNGLLRIYIDEADAGVGLEDCERVSREVSAQLDVHDPIRGRYNLEVSSPGLDRPLFRPEQYARFEGALAAVSMLVPLDGRRRFKGRILGVEGEAIRLEQDGVEVTLMHGNIAKARLVPEYD